MDSQEKMPLLLEYLFGEAAATAQRTASERLLAWSTAFEEWAAEVERTQHPKEYQRALRTWRIFLKQCGKPPWEATRADVEQYVEGRKTQGRAANTICHEIFKLSSFYKWGGRAGIDAETGQDFNPAAAIQKPKNEGYSQAQALNEGEAQALLDAFLHQGSVLSLRDHAFFLTRLRVGRPYQDVLQLRWGQIETCADGPWLRWRDGTRQLLEYEVYAAMLHYLRRSGRLERMAPQSYIFAPLKRGRQGGEDAEDWNENRPMEPVVILRNLKRFGRAVGIADDKLTMPALRHSAVRRRLEAGDNVQEIQAFLGGREIGLARDYIRNLPTPDDRPLPASPVEDPSTISREVHHFTVQEAMIHGAHAKHQPEEDLKWMLAQDVQGLDEELGWMEALVERLAGLLQQAEGDERPALMKATSNTGTRMMYVREAQRKLNRPKNSDEEDSLESFQRVENCLAEIHGRQPETITIETECSKHFKLVIASERLIVRRSFWAAMESEDVKAIADYAEVFSASCKRLAKLLMDEMKAREEELKDLFQVALEEALKEVREELNISL